MLTVDLMIATFERFVALGLDLPAKWAADPARMLPAAEAYVEELVADSVTPDELRAACRGYMRRPLAHGGRRPFPDVGMLCEEVRQVRRAAWPRFGDLEPLTKSIALQVWRDNQRGWGFIENKQPKAVADALIESMRAARVASRSQEEWGFICRDIEREYELRRGRASVGGVA